MHTLISKPLRANTAGVGGVTFSGRMVLNLSNSVLLMQQSSIMAQPAQKGVFHFPRNGILGYILSKVTVY